MKVEICVFNIPESLNNLITNRCFIYGRKYNRYGVEKHTHKHRSFVDFGNKTLLFDFQNIPEMKFWMRYSTVQRSTKVQNVNMEADLLMKLGNYGNCGHPPLLSALYHAD
jgi:hypothetical protein